MLIDTHCHIYFEDFDDDRDEVVKRAEEAGVTTFLNVGIDLESSKQSIAMARKYPRTYATVGIHPHDATKLKETNETELLALYDDPKVVAIGEIGLDYFRNISPKEVQIETFRYFLNLHKERQLPVVIHARDAFEDIVRVIREEVRGGIRGVLHCFSGDEAAMEEVLDVGLHVSFAGPVTYKKNDVLRQCAKKVPHDRILIETDSPYLSPQSRRGKRNEPCYVVETAQLIAEERAISYQELAEMTTKNAKELFNLPGI